MGQQGNCPYWAGQYYVPSWEFGDIIYDNFPNEDDAMNHGNANFTPASAAMVKQIRLLFRENVFPYRGGDPRIKIPQTVEKTRHTERRDGTVKTWSVEVAQKFGEECLVLSRELSLL